MGSLWNLANRCLLLNNRGFQAAWKAKPCARIATNSKPFVRLNHLMTWKPCCCAPLIIRTTARLPRFSRPRRLAKQPPTTPVFACAALYVWGLRLFRHGVRQALRQSMAYPSGHTLPMPPLRCGIWIVCRNLSRQRRCLEIFGHAQTIVSGSLKNQIYSKTITHEQSLFSRQPRYVPRCR